MPDELEEIRRRLEEVIRRAEENESFAGQLRDDPDRALSEVGIGADTLEAFRGTRPGDPEMGPMIRCNDFTCWSTRCGGSCYVTVCHTTYWW